MRSGRGTALCFAFDSTSSPRRGDALAVLGPPPAALPVCSAFAHANTTPSRDQARRVACRAAPAGLEMHRPRTRRAPCACPLLARAGCCVAPSMCLPASKAVAGRIRRTCVPFAANARSTAILRAFRAIGTGFALSRVTGPTWVRRERNNKVPVAVQVRTTASPEFSHRLGSRDAVFIFRITFATCHPAAIEAQHIEETAVMKIIVIGHGMVGHKLVECLAQDAAHGLDITVLCEESRPAYDRVHLSEFFSGKTADDLSLVEPGFFERQNVLLKLNAKAASIDRDARTVTVSTGETLPYDKLVFATGSYPFVPPVPGRERTDCFVYRTIDDLEAMRECGARSKTGTVVGGGLLGLECAKALRDMGLQTHVVEFAPRLMAVQVDDSGARVLRSKIEELGVTVHTQKNTVAIVDGEDGTHRMQFADASHLDTDMIVFSAGIRPRDEIARVSGLEVGARGGIVIDDSCRTSDADIYAIGECALWKGQVFGLVAPGYDMARVVARQLLGEQEAAFAGADMSTKLKLMGVDVASLGDAHAATAGSRTYQ